MRTRHLLLCGLILATVSRVGWERRAAAEDPLRMPVLRAIEQAKRYLIRQQNVEGHWEGERHQLHVGVTSLAVIALINTGMTSQDPEIQKALRWLRSTQTQSTYEISLKIQALSLAKDGKTDIPQIAALVRLLEESQLQNGSWSYFANQRGLFNPAGDRSNAQFAVLGLREAQEAGVPVDLQVWQRASDHFLRSQNRDGGWSYSGAEGGGSTGSMTVAGIATMLISEGMLKAQEEHLNRDGTPRCCTPTPDKTNLAAALRWLGNNFTVKYNPAPNRAVANNWVLYYLYGLERAGRFSGQRFFTNSRGDHFDWYREGAEYLVAQQNRVNGTWQGAGDGENDPIVGTSLALIFLSKGLAPVLFNKIEYGVRDPRTQLLTSDNWNKHPDDVRNLTQHITGLPKWPKLLNWQTVDIGRSTVSDLLQAPIALLTGDEPLRLDRRDLELLREYLDRGGFLLAVNNCRSAAFDESFRDIVRQLYPPSEARLQRLKPDHPVFRAEYDLIDEKTGEPSAELWGLEVGCRTNLIYSPQDLSCLWDKWTSFSVPKRPPSLVGMVSRSMQIGVNVVAYVTGREVLNKLERGTVEAGTDQVASFERDLIELRKIRYSGDWDAAPQALRRMMQSARGTANLPLSTNIGDITVLDRSLGQFPLLFLHGRRDFSFSQAEQERLRRFLDSGGFLFADACCASAEFDRGFRRLVSQLYPDRPIERIPADHELFLSSSAHRLTKVRRRESSQGPSRGALESVVNEVEPFLEGIQINNRFVIVYSKYDISCAMDRQAAVACSGYLHEDAVKIAVNVLVYGLNQ